MIVSTIAKPQSPKETTRYEVYSSEDGVVRLSRRSGVLLVDDAWTGRGGKYRWYIYLYSKCIIKPCTFSKDIRVFGVWIGRRGHTRVRVGRGKGQTRTVCIL